ncbi:hypothetical protein B0H19DRAFT_1231144 [Mycena capillaripes]|nr:hypothetical protein B0H19DRAFT_1231144 [Mycena capillaripes]
MKSDFRERQGKHQLSHRTPMGASQLLHETSSSEILYLAPDNTIQLRSGEDGKPPTIDSAGGSRCDGLCEPPVILAADHATQPVVPRTVKPDDLVKLVQGGTEEFIVEGKMGEIRNERKALEDSHREQGVSGIDDNGKELRNINNETTQVFDIRAKRRRLVGNLPEQNVDWNNTEAEDLAPVLYQNDDSVQERFNPGLIERSARNRQMSNFHSSKREFGLVVKEEMLITCSAELGMSPITLLEVESSSSLKPGDPAVSLRKGSNSDGEGQARSNHCRLNNVRWAALEVEVNKDAGAQAI